ncbi:hypothetical protein FRC10_010528 [Ceratobasidium sp. 414]|nr:hypothetical protein FRC10_010528 [Ceratobasidium sp. 414]
MSTPPTLSFDFAPIFASLDPYHTYTATPLSGGLINLTSRITISPNSGTEEHECPFGPVPISVVAKYAPPYIAAIGESAPFSQFRQVIEARALQLLSRPSAHAYIHSNHNHNVSTPSLIHHDLSAYVLLMSDLGHDSLALDRWLMDVCPSVEEATATGMRFGSFFARLGGLKDADLGSYLKPDFTNPGARKFVLDIVVRGVHANLLACGIDSAEADALTQVAVDAFTRQDEGDRKVFSLGDCWPKSLLVLSRGGLGVIDWEFAGMNAPLQDVGQLAAHLFLAHQTSPPASRPVIQACALGFYQAHRAQAPEWYYELSHRVDSWRLFGQEVVNNVVQAHWPDGDEAKREAEMKRLGKEGAEFMRDAERRAGEEAAGAPLFETLFARLQ